MKTPHPKGCVENRVATAPQPWRCRDASRAWSAGEAEDLGESNVNRRFHGIFIHRLLPSSWKWTNLLAVPPLAASARCRGGMVPPYDEAGQPIAGFPRPRGAIHHGFGRESGNGESKQAAGELRSRGGRCDPNSARRLRVLADRVKGCRDAPLVLPHLTQPFPVGPLARAHLREQG